jgi:hypothetical protein
MYLLSCEWFMSLMGPRSPHPISWMVQLGAWWSTSPLGYVKDFQFVVKHHRIDSAIVHPCVELATSIWHPTPFKLWCLLKMYVTNSFVHLLHDYQNLVIMQTLAQNLILPLFIQLSIDDDKGQPLQHQFLLLFYGISFRKIYSRDVCIHFM